MIYHFDLFDIQWSNLELLKRLNFYSFMLIDNIQSSKQINKMIMETKEKNNRFGSDNNNYFIFGINLMGCR